MIDCPHPTWIEIDLAKFRKNLKIIRSFVGKSRFCLPVKANAYGHGIIPIAEAAAPFVDCFGVSCLKEGMRLRQAGISLPILVFGAIHEGQIKLLNRFDLEFSISSKFKADLVNKISKTKSRVHLEIETGMQRTGVRVENALDFLDFVNQLSSIEVVGIYSHLATADIPDHPFAHQQLEAFEKLAKNPACRNLMCHIANSAGVVYHKRAHMDMVRPGLLSYGYLPKEHPKELEGISPCFSLKSRISFFKVVQEKSGISYGHTFVTEKATRLVTIPIGYGDGFLRVLSNRGECLIRGRRYPIRGAICMDQFMAEVGADEAYVGDEVVLIGKQGEAEICLETFSRRCGTILYETLCLFNDRIERLYLN